MNRKPPVGTPLNLQHPMVKDMVFFCVLNRSEEVDLINNIVGDRIGGGDMSLVTTSKGITTDWNNFETNTTVGFDFGNTVGGSGVYEPTELTIIASVRTGSVADAGGSRIISKRQGVTSNDDYCIYWIGDIITYRINGSDDVINPTGIGDLDNRSFEVAMAAASSGQDNYFWDLEGTGEQHDLANSGVPVNTSNGNLCVGHRESNDRSWNGLIHYVAMWRVKKDQAFIEAFRANPWQVFQQQRILIPMTAAEVVEQLGPDTTVFVTDVNTTESWNDGDTGLPITGTGFV